MSVETLATAEPKEVEMPDHRGILFRRFLQAGIANPELFPDVEEGALLFLLPDDDPEYVERELAAAANSARRGHDVYLHHVRVADLPELPSKPSGPPVGLRRTEFNRDGSIANQAVCGPDGEWHPVDPPEPVENLDGGSPHR